MEEQVPAVETLLEKAIRISREDLETCFNRSVEKYKLTEEYYNKLLAEGVQNLPELNTYVIRNGFTVTVKEPKEWGKIHRAIGKLSLYSKDAADCTTNKRGRKTQEVILTLAPGGYSHPLHYQIRFKVQRKLTKSDKCQVKVIKSKSVEVVCSLR